MNRGLIAAGAKSAAGFGVRRALLATGVKSAAGFDVVRIKGNMLKYIWSWESRQ